MPYLGDCKPKGGRPASDDEPQKDRDQLAWLNSAKLIDAALYYAERFGPVFPARIQRDKDTGKIGKKSCLAAEYSNGVRWGATRDQAELRKNFLKWYRVGKPEGIGFPTGFNGERNIFVVDLDTKEGQQS